MPANFKTYEAQSRLLAAVIAAHPELKLNFKAIARCFGSSATASAIEHRFRPLKKQGKALAAAVEQGIDPDTIDLDDICKYFGDSTKDGIQFYFRSVKTNAEALRTAVDSGENPALVKTTGGRTEAAATPRGRKRKTAADDDTPSKKSTTSLLTPATVRSVKARRLSPAASAAALSPSPANRISPAAAGNYEVEPFDDLAADCKAKHDCTVPMDDDDPFAPDPSHYADMLDAV